MPVPAWLSNSPLAIFCCVLGNVPNVQRLLRHALKIYLLRYKGTYTCDLCTDRGSPAQARPRSTLFTGSQKVAEQLTADLHGKVRFGDSLL